MAVMKLKVIAQYEGYKKIDTVVLPLHMSLMEVKNTLTLRYKTNNILIKSC